MSLGAMALALSSFDQFKRIRTIISLANLTTWKSGRRSLSQKTLLFSSLLQHGNSLEENPSPIIFIAKTITSHFFLPQTKESPTLFSQVCLSFSPCLKPKFLSRTVKIMRYQFEFVSSPERNHRFGKKNDFSSFSL